MCTNRFEFLTGLFWVFLLENPHIVLFMHIWSFPPPLLVYIGIGCVGLITPLKNALNILKLKKHYQAMASECGQSQYSVWGWHFTNSYNGSCGQTYENKAVDLANYDLCEMSSSPNKSRWKKCGSAHDHQQWRMMIPYLTSTLVLECAILIVAW